jgi:glycosyltransferase involved in cell wall biosynthesis
MSSKTPLVSVVMPAYNAEKYISEAIESILNQTFKDFEFIIINDGSTDSTPNIIDKYARLDKRIIVLNNEKNLNIAESRNRGVEIAKGKYIATMDSDDRALPDRLKNQLEFLESNKDVAISIGNINIMDGKGVFQYTRKYPVTNKDIRSKVYRFNPFPNPTIMCRREVYEKNGKYNNAYVPIDDFDFWLRAGTQFKFGNCGKIVLNYRVVEGSASHRKLRLTERLTFKLRWKAFKLGYKFTVGDVFFNLFHFISYLLLPSGLKIKLFDLLRKNKII